MNAIYGQLAYAQQVRMFHNVDVQALQRRQVDGKNL
jgi:hypothetical protein